MGQEGVMTQRRKFSAEYKREAVAMLDYSRGECQPDRRGTGDWGERARALAAGVASGAGAGISGQRPIAR